MGKNAQILYALLHFMLEEGILDRKEYEGLMKEMEEQENESLGEK